MSPFTEEYKNARLRALVVLANLIKNEVGLIEASRKLAGIRYHLIGDKLDDDWRIFVAIDSDSDDLPIGRVRAHWQAEALAKKDKEIQERELFYREAAFTSAKNLIKRYEDGAEVRSGNP